MKKWFLVLFGASIIISGCGGDEEEEGMNQQPAEVEEEDSGTVNVAAAEEVYKNSSCIGCHGGDLGGGAGPALTEIGSRKSKEEILHVIQNGQGSMPGGLLQGKDAELVAAWLATMK